MPGIFPSDFSSGYIINSNNHSVENLQTVDYHASAFPSTSPGNPANVYFRNGDLRITGDLTIYGTLVVTHDITINDDSSLTVIRKPGYDLLAIICGHEIRVQHKNK